ncbi:MAG: metal ABC transporter ATP-binding protein [Phycisphaerales bacterium]|nr:metal ABC transporter ATP-binding protein [Phycisphaerales bacterium]
MTSPERRDQAAVSFEHVSFRWPAGPRPALEDITFDVRPGERLGVLGPNGGGKSTLLKLMLGLISPDSGRVRVCGLAPRDACAAGYVGYLPQRIEAELRFPVSALGAVTMPLLLRAKGGRAGARAARQQARSALELVGAGELADRPVGSLSGGQLQRVMIARAAAGHPRVLLLDEPMVGVDVVGQERFAGMIARLHERLGLTIITVSHDLRAVAAGSDRIACLNRTLHAHTSPGGLTPQVLAEVFRHDVAGIFGDIHIDAHKASDCADPSHGPAPGAGAAGALSDALRPYVYPGSPGGNQGPRERPGTTTEA